VGLHDCRVRFLFTFTGGTGHFLPTLPIAKAIARRGHEVAFACQAAMVRTVEAAGFVALESGGTTLLDPKERRPLLPVDRSREERVVRATFAGSIAQERAGRLRDLAGSWRPDVMVRDEMDFGSVVAAESLGIPHAGVIVIAAGGLLRPELIAQPLDALRSEYGLAPDPEFEMLHRYLTFVPVPASFRDPGDPLPPTAHHLRPAALDTDGHESVGIFATDRERSTVYFSLGTVFHQEAGDLFTRVLAGLRDLPLNIIVTVGREADPAELGIQPPHVHIEQFLPQAGVLPWCDVTVSHGGSGSVIGSLAFGLPSVLLPMGADQPLNGDRCVDLGVAHVLDACGSSPQEIGDAVTSVLEDHSYRLAASRIRDEIRTLPGDAYAADLLVRLARDRSPVVAHS
jgi:UDP:flavonoid glycosyltransferase YjiC (YdhE family)